MELRCNQNRKLNQLKASTDNLLDSFTKDNKIYFSAPTGSGKTLILSNLI